MRKSLPALALAKLGVALALAVAIPAPAEAAPFDVEVRRDIVYSRPDGEELRLDAYLPKGAGPFPAVLVVHGGAWRSGSKLQLSLQALALARDGLAAFAIDYRLAPRHKWPAQIHDCKAAVRWIRSRAAEHRVDPDAIGAYGYSAGGHLVALLGTTDESAALEGEADGTSARVSAVVAGGAPCDFQGIAPRARTFAFWLGGTREELPAVYREASPLAYVSAGDAPVLFFHGENDLLVSKRDPERMVEALRAAGVESDLIVLGGLGHIAAAIWPSALESATAFLLRHLRPQRTRVF